MGSVRVPPEFFRGELRLYSSWQEAFWRELLQNSIDANASRVDIGIVEQDGAVAVVVADDGHGMDRHTLDEVFFALGATTKVTGNTIGGFGRARIITCFAQRSYRIRTGNLSVKGSGGDYEITVEAVEHQGCEFRIDTVADNAGTLRSALTRLLNESAVQSDVRINGELWVPEALPARASRVLVDSNGQPWAKAYRYDGDGVATIRVGGLAMYSRYLGTDSRYVIEIPQQRSREVLAASRDFLAAPFEDQLHAFLMSLVKNKQTMSARHEPVFDRLLGGGVMRCEAPHDAHRLVDPQHGDQNRDPVVGAHLRGVNHTTSTALVSIEDDVAVHQRALAAALGLSTDLYVVAEETTPNTRRMLRKWHPVNWPPEGARRRRQLLAAWTAAVDQAVKALLGAQPHLGAIYWAPGWVFGAEVLAQHRCDGHIHVVCVNPVDVTGVTRFQLSSAAGRRRLLAEALHEVAHIAAADHDEMFAAGLTELMGRVDPGVADRAIRSAVAAVR